MIYRMFDGRHIDLSKIVSIGPIMEIESRELLPPRHGFHVWFRDKNIVVREPHPETVCEEAGFKEGDIIVTRCQADADAVNIRLVSAAKRKLEDAHASLLSAWQSLVEKAA